MITFGYIIFTIGNILITISSIPQIIKLGKMIYDKNINLSGISLGWVIITLAGLSSFEIAYISWGWEFNYLLQIPGLVTWTVMLILKLWKR